ncbi:alpha/beta fold hydrolase [Patescibacteria group bacterium]|nr:alpha/beta fold hydrolase [Patescibacteria group bacterium]
MFIILAVLAVITIGGSYIVFYNFTHPRRQPKKSTPLDINIEFEDIYFLTKDNCQLRGWFISSKIKTDKVIIICHGYRSNKTDVFERTLGLREKFNLFYFDFRTHGKSQGRSTTFGWHEAKDLQAAIDYLKARPGIDGDNLGIYGFSMGGMTTLLNVVKTPEIKAVIADSVPATMESIIKVFHNYFFLKRPAVKLGRFWFNKCLRINIDEMAVANKVSQITIPVLLIHSKDDPIVPCQDSQTIFDNLSCHKELWLTEKGKHGKIHEHFQQEYEQKILNFFNQKLNNLT